MGENNDFGEVVLVAVVMERGALEPPSLRRNVFELV